MLEFLPHWVLTALVASTAVLFLEKGRERRDLLCMGTAALFVAVWMAAVTMTDFTVQREQTVPVFWLALAVDAQLPALLFIFASVLQLQKYYDPQCRIRLREWLPLTLLIAGLALAHGFEPELFYRRVRLEAPDPGRLHLNPLYTLKFSLGPGYLFFLAAAAYVLYGVATRFPRILEAMRLPEAERRTRLLLSMGVLSAFWVSAFDVVPTLFSTSAPSFMRLVGPAIGVAGTGYAMVLTRALDPRAIVRNALFYVIRVLLIAVPAIVLIVRYRDQLAHLSARSTGLITLCAVVAIDFLALRLKPLLDWLALRKSYSSVEAINRYVHDLLVARDARAFSRTVKDFLRHTVGAADVRVWMPPLDQPSCFHDAESEKRIELPASTRELLIARATALTPDDMQLDPHLFPARNELAALFERLSAEVILPLVDEDRLVGMLSLGAKESFERYYDQDLTLLDSLRPSTAVALQNTLHFETVRLGKPLKVYDRAELDQALERFWHQARRSNESLSIGFLRLAAPAQLDADFGPGMAARYTAAAAEYLRPTLRGRDLPALYDPMTIVFAFPQTKLAGAEIAIRRIRSVVEEADIELDGQIVRSRFVIGLATRSDDIHAPADLYRQAEEALSDATALSGLR